MDQPVARVGGVSRADKIRASLGPLLDLLGVARRTGVIYVGLRARFDAQVAIGTLFVTTGVQALTEKHIR